MSQMSNGFTALHLAAQEGRLEVVKALLAQGATVNTPNTQGWTPCILRF